MKKNSFFLKSNCDGLKLYVTCFIPEIKPKGIIQFVHGMVEHQIYYYDLMEKLCNNGYVCIISDLRGHGKSVKNKKDLGYFYDEKAEYVVEDIHQITKYIKDKYPKLDVVLFGHSMGSLIVRKYIKEYDYEIDKLIVCGSPSINKMSRFGLRLTKLIKLFRGDYHRSKLLNNMALSNDSTYSWLTINNKYLEEYKNDSYCGYIFTINGFINLMKLMIDVYSKDGWVLKNKDLDILFIAGSEDSIIKGKNNYIKSINYIKNVGYYNVNYKLYDGYRHAIFEDDLELVHKDILAFVEN